MPALPTNLCLPGSGGEAASRGLLASSHVPGMMNGRSVAGICSCLGLTGNKNKQENCSYIIKCSEEINQKVFLGRPFVGMAKSTRWRGTCHSSGTVHFLFAAAISVPQVFMSTPTSTGKSCSKLFTNNRPFWSLSGVSQRCSKKFGPKTAPFLDRVTLLQTRSCVQVFEQVKQRLLSTCRATMAMASDFPMAHPFGPPPSNSTDGSLNLRRRGSPATVSKTAEKTSGNQRI